WRVWSLALLLPHYEQFVLRWETPLLLRLGDRVAEAGRRGAAAYGAAAAATAMAAAPLLIPLAAVAAVGAIDSDWPVACNRADLAGRVLADALLTKAHGGRPVTLVGYSFGARVIFAALLEMARRHALWQEEQDSTAAAAAATVMAAVDHKGAVAADETSFSWPNDWGPACAAGIVENAVLLGAPVGCDAAEWTAVAAMVAGRVVNGFSSQDWLLRYLHRARDMGAAVAGATAVDVP
ncbi:unnamed protein product, partial [Phaeothamnion confervicola]